MLLTHNFLASSDRDKQYESFFLAAGGLKFLQNNVQIIFLQYSNKMDFFFKLLQN